MATLVFERRRPVLAHGRFGRVAAERSHIGTSDHQHAKIRDALNGAVEKRCSRAVRIDVDGVEAFRKLTMLGHQLAEKNSDEA